MTKIDLITGILGAGKTTFLLRYARYCLDRGEKIAVLENDFGAVNVDMLLLQELKCENCLLQTVSGCTDPHCHRRRFRTQLIALGLQLAQARAGALGQDPGLDRPHHVPDPGLAAVEPLPQVAELGRLLVLLPLDLGHACRDRGDHLIRQHRLRGEAHDLAGTIFAKRLARGDDQMTLYCYPAFLKLRWRDGNPVDAKSYLIAGVQ